MSTTQMELGDLMARRQATVDPSNHPDESFHLFSIPAFDSQEPDTLIGADIGSAKKSVEPDDVLLSRIVPHIRRAWVVPKKNGKRQIASSEWIVFRGKEFFPPYLRYFLTSDQFHAQFMNTVAGVGGSLLRARPDQVANIPITLPKLEEQKRIAAILDKAAAIRRKRQESMTAIKDLIDSQFLHVFGDPVGNPQNWTSTSFNDHVSLLQYGPRFYNEAYSERKGVRIVRITDLDFQGRLNYAAMPLMDASDEDRRKFVLKPGDLLLARSGATVGKTALIDERAPECIAGAYFIRLRFSDAIRPLYAQMVLRSQSVQKLIASRSQQSAQQNFNGPAIRALPLPVPPVDVQDTFVKFHTSAITTGEKMAEHASESNDLFNSLVQRAFKGEL